MTNLSTYTPKVRRWQTKLVVCGTRTFDDYPLLKKKLDKYTEGHLDVVVVTGAARGADALAERWAFVKRFTVYRFHPDWQRFGKKAGPKRNAEILDFTGRKNTVCVAFWDGESRGTKDMIERCRRKGIKLKIIRV